MKIKIIIFSAILLFSCAHAPTTNNSNTDFPTSSFMRVEINLGDQIAGLGSGFVVQEAALGSIILTAAHVCQPSPELLLSSLLLNQKISINVRSYDGLLKNATIIKADKVQDLCLLYAPEMYRPAVTFAEDVPSVGAPVYVIGAPQGFSSPVDGLVPIIAGVYNGFITNGENRFQTYTARISPGNSGGMVVNEFGEVVGNTNFAWFMRYGYADICGGSRLDLMHAFVFGKK